MILFGTVLLRGLLQTMDLVSFMRGVMLVEAGKRGDGVREPLIWRKPN